MTKIVWGIDGHGRTWPWCQACGKQFGMIEPFRINHKCNGHGFFQPRRIDVKKQYMECRSCDGTGTVEGVEGYVFSTCNACDGNGVLCDGRKLTPDEAMDVEGVVVCDVFP